MSGSATPPADWPHRAASRQVQAGGVDWHVQRFGSGPALVLIHGTGASVHSYRALAERLSDRFEIVMADLPGHGFSGAMPAPALSRVASALAALLDHLDVEPAMLAGHSAGAPIALQMTMNGLVAPKAVIGLAPALKPYGGPAQGLAAGAVNLALLNPVTPRFVAGRANPTRVARLIARTGSHLDEEGLALYTRLFSRPAHIAGTLGLMAHVKLEPLLDRLAGMTTPVTLLAGEADLATPLRDISWAARRMPGAGLIRLPGVGHLLHEEDPDAVADHITAIAEQAGLFSAASAPIRPSARTPARTAARTAAPALASDRAPARTAGDAR